MGIWDWFKRKENPIDFSQKNIADLKNLSDELGQTLINSGLGHYIEFLSQIKLAAQAKNETQFKELVISRELFGGSGALWEIHMEDETQYKKFNQQFCDYIDIVLRMGINNRRIRQTRKLMPKLI